MFLQAQSRTEIPPFLALLDAIVRGDRAPPGFRGVVCIGVRGTKRTRWWVGHFERTATTYYCAEMPVGYDVAIGLTEEHCRAIGRGIDPQEDCWMTGDRRVLGKFSSRYLRSKDWLSVRLGSCET